MSEGKDIVAESWDVQGDMETVRAKWAEFTTVLRFAAGPKNGPTGGWLSLVRPETEGEAERIVFEQITPETTRVTVGLRYDADELSQEGETFADVAHRVDQDMSFFREFAEGRVSRGELIGKAS